VWWQTVSWFLDPPDHTDTVRDVNHPPEFLCRGEIRWCATEITRTILRMDFVTNASPVIGEGAFCKQKVQREPEVEHNRTAHSVCHREWVGDLWRSVDLGCDVDHGGEYNHPIGMLMCWVENDDVENLEENNLRPRISSHDRRGQRASACLSAPDIASRETGTVITPAAPETTEDSDCPLKHQENAGSASTKL